MHGTLFMTLLSDDINQNNPLHDLQTNYKPVEVFGHAIHQYNTQFKQMQCIRIAATIVVDHFHYSSNLLFPFRIAHQLHMYV